MSYASSRDRYLENEILSRPTEWLVPLMYEHLIGTLHRAAAQIEHHDLEGKAASITKATTILLELAGTLDNGKGGEVASGLANLYTFFITEIAEISRTLDIDRMEKLIAILSELHDAWAEAAETVAPRGQTKIALAS